MVITRTVDAVGGGTVDAVGGGMVDAVGGRDVACNVSTYNASAVVSVDSAKRFVSCGVIFAISYPIQ